MQRAFLGVWLLAALTACGEKYTGPFSSQEAETALRELGLFERPGRQFRDETGALGGGECILYATRLSREHTWLWLYYKDHNEEEDTRLPVRTDGDVADLFWRVTGRKHASLRGSMSQDYRSFLYGNLFPTASQRTEEPPKIREVTASFSSKIVARVFSDLDELMRFQDVEGVFGGGECLFGKCVVSIESTSTEPDSVPSIWESMTCVIRSGSDKPRFWLIAGDWFADGTTVIPLRTGGDAGDLYRRITGESSPWLSGPLSKEYEAFLARRGR